MIQCSGHCQTFKSTTYPSIVNIANDVYNYAQDAGGNLQDSYYGTSALRRRQTYASALRTLDSQYLAGDPLFGHRYHAVPAGSVHADHLE